MNTPSQSSSHHVVIVGGGFGGVRAARLLSRQPVMKVTLISDNPSFTYYPQLYHAATGGSRSETALPLKELLKDTTVEILKDTAVSVDHAAHTITMASKTVYTYDRLILSLGSVTNYFHIQGLPENCFEIKSTPSATAFKHHLHNQLIEDQATDANYLIVGGGPTGVELAGALDAYLERIVKLHGITKGNYAIKIVEAMPRLLPRLPESVAKRVQQRLEELGVSVMTGAKVEAAGPDSLTVNGKAIPSETVVWTAGIANNPFFKANEDQFKLAKNGRVEVSNRLQVHPGVYVIGDNAAVEHGGLAQNAIAQADFVADDIVRSYAKASRKIFRSTEGISAIPVGPYWAVVVWGKLKLYGRLGWLLRRAADLMAYRDIEQLPGALRVWSKDFKTEDDCQICAQAD
ncbi:MAG TPA: FAD-dependent oxidoreductase [Candidatus Polarisedimenticolaceae bacterium]|nr:FAD-dependent oxidoreductase [Candidatus Polarisedimenticolaceae bacterium]